MGKGRVAVMDDQRGYISSVNANVSTDGEERVGCQGT